MYPNTFKVSKEARATEFCWSWIHSCLRGYWELNLGPLEYQDMSQVLSYISLGCSIFCYDRVSLYISSWPGACYVHQAGLKFTEFCLPLVFEHCN